MKYLSLVLLVVLTGCGITASRNVFNVEFAAASTADAFMRGYGTYWKAASNNPAAYGTDMNHLTAERNKLSQMSKKVGASVEVVENLRAANITNNLIAPNLQTAIDSLDSITTLLVASTTNVLSH